MLIKLLKYEIRATSRLLLPLYVALLIFAGINSLLFSIPSEALNTSFLYSVTSIISMVIYITIMVGILVMTLVVMIQRFYKNLLGDEGYLMFTLPVQTWKHILSKLLIAMLWIISSGIIAATSIFIIAHKSLPLGEIPIIFETLEREFGMNGYLFSFELTILAVLGLAANIVLIYSAIALGHLFNKHQLLASFGMYVALTIVCQIVIALLGYGLGNFIEFSDSSMTINYQIQVLFLFSFINVAILGIGSFILTQLLLKKKLNLE
ncbi:MAG: ABC transporter permease [Firmicutes bacterium HGW-Firmicutes-7]|nr:MAG: ABC transporter permease [Firmicutes bacterium HGW-Firmicutes-7]